jgi:hypothetical protein
VSNLESPSRSDLALLSPPTVDVVADAAMLPPPGLRVPALDPPSLPSLTGAPVVPPMPRLSLDEADAAITLAAGHNVHGDESSDRCPQIVESTTAAPVISLGEVFGATPGEPAPGERAPREIVPLAKPMEIGVPALPGTPVLPGEVPAPVPALTAVLPAASGQILSPAHEPAGTPPQVAMAMPALPTLAAAAPSPQSANPDTSSHHPVQAGVAPMKSLADAMASPNSAAKAPSDGSLGRSLARTLTAVVLAGVVGVGAHVGYDWWENRDATAVGGVNVDGTELASWPQVDPPAIRYTDSVTVFRTDAGSRTLTAHREISTGLTQAEVVSTDAAGVVVSQTELDLRGEQSFVRPAPEAAWALAPEADALALLGDAWTADVFSVRDLFPAEAMPYITVLESVERLLPVKPLQPAAGLGSPEAPIAISTEPTSMVWQYRVIIDIESFRANETIAFQDWQRRIGRSAVPRMEAWVDNTGIVRQVAVDVDGAKVTHTLVAGAAASTRFDTNPLLDPAPATLPAPVSVPVPVDPNGAEVGE